MIKKFFITNTVLLLGILLSAPVNADYQVTTTEPLYPVNPVNYASGQPYHNTLQYSDYLNNPCYNAQTVEQYHTPCYNRYWNRYRSPHVIYNPVTRTYVNTSNSTVGNVGRSLLYSIFRGY